MVQQKIQWAGHSSDGLVHIDIDNRTYTYRIDAAFLADYIKQFRFSPGTVLGKLKRNCLWWADPEGNLHENKEE
jgi:hypothetical protein